MGLVVQAGNLTLPGTIGFQANFLIDIVCWETDNNTGGVDVK